MHPLEGEEEAAARAYGWLTSQSGLLTNESRWFASCLDWLAATWIYESGLSAGDQPIASQSGARAVATHLNDLTQSQAFGQLLACDAQRVILARGILVVYDV